MFHYFVGDMIDILLILKIYYDYYDFKQNEKILAAYRLRNTSLKDPIVNNYSSNKYVLIKHIS